MPGDNKLSCMPDKDTEEWNVEKTHPCVMNGVEGILDNLIVADGQARGENCRERSEDINVACELGCQKECLDKPLTADTAEEGRDEERSSGQAIEVLRSAPPSGMLDENDLAKILYTEWMCNQKTSAGLAAEAPHGSAEGEEQEKRPTAAADEVAPLAPKRRRRVQDGMTIMSLKDRLRHLGAKTTGNKADLLDRLAGLAAEAPDPSAHAEEQEEAARAAADEVTPLAPKRRRRMRDGPSVASLKEALRGYGASTTGNKAELLDRVAECKANDARKERSPRRRESHNGMCPGTEEDSGASEAATECELHSKVTMKEKMEEMAKKMMAPNLSAEELASKIETEWGHNVVDEEKEILLQIAGRTVRDSDRGHRHRGNKRAQKSSEEYFSRYSWSFDASVPANLEERIDIAKQIRLLRASMCKLQKTDPKHAEASRRMDIMIAKRDQRGAEFPEFSELDAVANEMGRNAADGQRLKENMMTVCGGLKRYSNTLDNWMTEMQNIFSRSEELGAKSVALASGLQDPTL